MPEEQQTLSRYVLRTAFQQIDGPESSPADEQFLAHTYQQTLSAILDCSKKINAPTKAFQQWIQQNKKSFDAHDKKTQKAVVKHLSQISPEFLALLSIEPPNPITLLSRLKQRYPSNYLDSGLKNKIKTWLLSQTYRNARIQFKNIPKTFQQYFSNLRPILFIATTLSSQATTLAEIAQLADNLTALLKKQTNLATGAINLALQQIVSLEKHAARKNIEVAKTTYLNTCHLSSMLEKAGHNDFKVKMMRGLRSTFSAKTLFFLNAVLPDFIFYPVWQNVIEKTTTTSLMPMFDKIKNAWNKQLIFDTKTSDKTKTGDITTLCNIVTRPHVQNKKQKALNELKKCLAEKAIAFIMQTKNYSHGILVLSAALSILPRAEKQRLSTQYNNWKKDDNLLSIPKQTTTKLTEQYEALQNKTIKPIQDYLNKKEPNKINNYAIRMKFCITLRTNISNQPQHYFSFLSAINKTNVYSFSERMYLAARQYPRVFDCLDTNIQTVFREIAGELQKLHRLRQNVKTQWLDNVPPQFHDERLEQLNAWLKVKTKEMPCFSAFMQSTDYKDNETFLLGTQQKPRPSQRGYFRKNTNSPTPETPRKEY
jgi:hypothetical protein